MKSAKRLNPLDWTFLAGESGETMMMVGALMPFSPWQLAQTATRAATLVQNAQKQQFNGIRAHTGALALHRLSQLCDNHD